MTNILYKVANTTVAVIKTITATTILCSRLINFKNLYFGFITEMYPKIDHGDQRLVYVFHQLMNQLDEYKLSYETISEENKKLYLIKKN